VAGVREGAEVKLPGPLAIWQGLATSLGGALLASIMGVNALQERSLADQRTIVALQGEVRTLVAQVQTLAVEVGRQGERIEAIRVQGNDRNGVASSSEPVGLRAPRN
jgi:hypothetical protein